MTRYAWLAGLALLVLVALHRLVAFDVWWQIAAGRWILQHGFPEVDPFSYAFPGREWIELRWLYCVTVEGVYRLLGPNGLIVAKLVAVTTAAMVWIRAAGRDTPPLARAVGILVMLAAVHDRLTVRPELVTFVLLGAMVWLLESGRRHEDSRRVVWVLPLQLLWVNAHTLAVLGPIVLSIHALTSWNRGNRLRKQGVVLAVLGWCMLLATPYGWRGATFPFQLWSQIRSGHYLDNVIAEFHGPLSDLWLRADGRTIGFVACLLVSAASFLLAGRSRSWFRLLLWGLFLYLALQAVRNVALFGWVAGFATVANLSDWQRGANGFRIRQVERWVAVGSWLCFLAVAPLLVSGQWSRLQHSVKQFGFGVSDRRFPIDAWAFVEQAGLPQPVLHGIGDGGYLAHVAGPGGVLVDGRLEVYGGELLARTLPMIETGVGLEAFTRQHGIGTVLVRDPVIRSGLFQTLERLPNWVAVYVDPRHVIFVKMQDTTREIVERYRVDWFDPGSWNPGFVSAPGPWTWPGDGGGVRFEAERIGLLLSAVGNYDDGEARIAAAVAAGSRDPRVQEIHRLYQLALQEDEADLEAAVGWDIDDADLARLGGEIQLHRLRPRRAFGFFVRAEALAPESPLYVERASAAALAAGEYEAARVRLQRLQLQFPDRTQVWNLSAVLAEREGLSGEAANHYRRSLALDDRQPAVRRRLTELESP